MLQILLAAEASILGPFSSHRVLIFTRHTVRLEYNTIRSSQTCSQVQPSNHVLTNKGKRWSFVLQMVNLLNKKKKKREGALGPSTFILFPVGAAAAILD